MKKWDWKYTFALGVIVAGILACLTFFLVPAQMSVFPRTDISAALIVFVLVLVSGKRQIQVGFGGALLVFGKRVGIALDEGYHWLGPFPFILSFKEVDLRERTQKLDPLQVFTSDGARVTVDGAIVWKVKNLFDYLSITESVIKDELDDIFDQVVRQEAITKPLDEVLELGVKLTDVLTDEAVQKSKAWGIEILRVPIPTLLPDEEVIKALALERRQEAQVKADVVQLENVRARIAELTAPAMGFSPDKAAEIVQVERGKVTKEVKELKLAVDDQTAKTFVSGLEAIFGKTGGGR